MRYEIRPLINWDRPKNQSRARSARFRATWQSTLDLLCREVEMLDGQLVVVQIDVQEGDLRRDGMLYARAKVGFPGVKVSFDSRHGSLTYATDAYDRWTGSDPPGWQANVRAIALALEALRAVDRYGVTSSGEQYRGWTAIDSTPHIGPASREEAARELIAAAGLGLSVLGPLLTHPEDARATFRMAARKHHPDVGGDPELFRRLTAARDLLLAGAS